MLPNENEIYGWSTVHEQLDNEWSNKYSRVGAVSYSRE